MMEAHPESGYVAAFHALSPAERDRIAETFASAAQMLGALSTGLRRAMPDAATFADGLAELHAERAEQMRKRIWAATPIDRRPEVRRLLQSLDDLPSADVMRALSDALLFVDDPFYRLFPTGRGWAIAWGFWRTIRGQVVTLTAQLVSDPRTLRAQAAPGLAKPGPSRRREREQRRPLRLAYRLSANAPPRRNAAPRMRGASTWPVTYILGPP